MPVDDNGPHLITYLHSETDLGEGRTPVSRQLGFKRVKPSLSPRTVEVVLVGPKLGIVVEGWLDKERRKSQLVNTPRICILVSKTNTISCLGFTQRGYNLPGCQIYDPNDLKRPASLHSTDAPTQPSLHLHFQHFGYAICKLSCFIVLFYLVAVNFHDQRPSSTSACSNPRASHVAVDRNFSTVGLYHVSSISLGPKANEMKHFSRLQTHLL